MVISTFTNVFKSPTPPSTAPLERSFDIEKQHSVDRENREKVSSFVPIVVASVPITRLTARIRILFYYYRLKVSASDPPKPTAAPIPTTQPTRLFKAIGFNADNFLHEFHGCRFRYDGFFFRRRVIRNTVPWYNRDALILRSTILAPNQWPDVATRVVSAIPPESSCQTKGSPSRLNTTWLLVVVSCCSLLWEEIYGDFRSEWIEIDGVDKNDWHERFMREDMPFTNKIWSQRPSALIPPYPWELKNHLSADWKACGNGKQSPYSAFDDDDRHRSGATGYHWLECTVLTHHH
jgi:hypothetical protein